MHKRREVGDLLGAHRKRRHTPVGATCADDGADQFALLIVEHELRAQEAWPTVATANVSAVAERAVSAEGGTPALDGGLIFFTLGIRADADATDSAAARGGGRLRLLSGDDQRKN